MLNVIFWSLLMLTLIGAVVVVGIREKKAAAKARQALAPQPMMTDDMTMPGENPEFSEFQDAGVEFGAGENFGELQDFDQNSFK